MKAMTILLLIVCALSPSSAWAKVKDLIIKQESMNSRPANRFKVSLNHLSALDNSCGYEFANFVDARQNKETVARKVAVSGVDDWLVKMREQLAQAPTQPKQGVNIKVLPKLTRLYAYNESTNINGVTALMLDFEVNGKVIDSRHYRGFYAKLNWADGHKEFLSAINYSSHNAMIKIVKDLRDVCKLAIEKSS